MTVSRRHATGSPWTQRKEHVQIGPLSMYCETLGQGHPLLLLHASMSTIETSFGALRQKLAERWTTLAVEQQVLWSRSYCVLSCGGASLSIIQQQDRPDN